MGFRRRRVSTSFGVLSVIDEGPADAPVMLLLHGAPMTSIGFARMISPLRRRFRVIAPDLPGFGDSELPDGFDGTLAAHADAVVSLCQTMDLDRITFYVNDTSGCIGLAAAATLHARVAGLVVADTVPIPMTGRARVVPPLLRLVSSRLVRALNRRFNLLAWMVATIAPLFRPLPRAIRRAMVAAFDTPEKRERILDLLAALATDETFLRDTAERVTERLQSVPTLILYGQLDPMRFVGGPARYAKLLPRSERVIIPLEEHFPMLGSGARVAAAIDRWTLTNGEPRIPA